VPDLRGNFQRTRLGEPKSMGFMLSHHRDYGVHREKQRGSTITNGMPDKFNRSLPRISRIFANDSIKFVAEVLVSPLKTGEPEFPKPRQTPIRWKPIMLNYFTTWHARLAELVVFLVVRMLWSVPCACLSFASTAGSCINDVF